VIAGDSPGWIFDPSGLDEATARAAQPEFDRIRRRFIAASRELRIVEQDRALRLTLLETQDAQIRALQERLAEVDADRAQRLQLLEQQDAQIGELQKRLAEVEDDSARRLEKLVQLDRDHRALEARLQESESESERRDALVRRLSGELAANAKALGEARQLADRQAAAMNTQHARDQEREARLDELQTTQGALRALARALLGKTAAR
jgi:chromosome segregation ATPase